jgi:hypothetical protein
MPLPVVLALGYLIVNFAIMVWLVREEAAGRVPHAPTTIIARVLRYGPPLLGLVYLVTIAGDWPFFLFVLTFFTVAFGLLNGLLSTPIRPPRK